MFLYNVPEDLGRYYPEKYYHLPASREELARRAVPERYRLQLIQRYFTSGRLLEIGPSYGLLAYLAKEAGFEVDVIEMDTQCCQFLAEVVGVNVIQSSKPHEALIDRGPYDVVVMQHVIEHLTEPWHCLRQASAELASNGILCVSAPNPAAMQFKLLRSRWVHLDAPRHLHLIPAGLLIEFLRESNLAPVMITCNDQGGIICNQAGWIASVAHAAAAGPVRRLLWRIGQVAYRALRPIIEPIESAGLNGSAYTLVARKV